MKETICIKAKQKKEKTDTAEEMTDAMQNQKTKRDRDHEPEARSQNAVFVNHVARLHA